MSARFRSLGPVWAALCALLLLACGDKKPKYPLCTGDKDCKEGEHCINKQCVQCGEDSHCPEGMECREGGCVAKEVEAEAPDPDAHLKPCQVDTDCADDEDCIDGRCRKPWQNEDPDLACQLATVYFAFDDATIGDDARGLLGSSAECLQKAPDRSAFVEGHTDPTGTEEYNIALSERRARAVADYLARLGIDPARLHIVPKGEAEPTGAGDDRDRRVILDWK